MLNKGKQLFILFFNILFIVRIFEQIHTLNFPFGVFFEPVILKESIEAKRISSLNNMVV